MHQPVDALEVTNRAMYASIVTLNEIIIAYRCSKVGGLYRQQAEHLAFLRQQLMETAYLAKQMAETERACAMFGNAAC